MGKATGLHQQPVSTPGLAHGNARSKAVGGRCLQPLACLCPEVGVKVVLPASLRNLARIATRPSLHWMRGPETLAKLEAFLCSLCSWCLRLPLLLLLLLALRQAGAPAS